MKYIGEKQISKTFEDQDMVLVEYVDGTKETLAKIMFDEIVSEEKCDLTTLRDKRVRPVVAHVLAIMRAWGIKTGEVGYFSLLLNQSLQANEEAAIKHLWKEFIPTIETLDDIDLVAVDRVLKTIPSDILSPYAPENDTPDTK